MKFLADAVVVVADKATGEPALVIIIEPQGRDDPTKEFSWPIYVTVARRHLRCQRALLLVICPDPDEAKKCRRLISTGHPGFDLIPAVIDPLNAPGVGGASPYLAIFAAFMGALNLEEDQGARTFLTAVRESGASAADRKRLSTIMLNLASDAARRRLETMMTTMEWKSDFIEGFVQEGLQEGLQKGLQKGPASRRCHRQVRGRSQDHRRARDRRDCRATQPGLLVHRHRPARPVVRQRPHGPGSHRHLQELTASAMSSGTTGELHTRPHRGFQLKEAACVLQLCLPSHGRDPL